jgi:hypothetical protein
LDRKKSGDFTARKVIPKDVRARYEALYGRGWEERFRAPSTETPGRAKALFSAWQAEVDHRIAALRAEARGERKELTQVQAQALAGQWYTWWVGLHLENPGEPWHWHQLADFFAGAIIDATPSWDAEEASIDQSRRAREPEVREEVHPMLAREAKTAQFLASRGGEPQRRWQRGVPRLGA